MAKKSWANNPLYISSNKEMYEIIKPDNNWLFGLITRNKAEQILINTYNSKPDSYWLVREKDHSSYVISIIDINRQFIHLKLDKMQCGEFTYFRIGNVKLIICTSIEEAILVLQKCKATSYLITGQRKALLKNIIQILNY